MMNKSIFLIHVYQEFNRFCITRSLLFYMLYNFCLVRFNVFAFYHTEYLNLLPPLYLMIQELASFSFNIIVDRNQVSWEIKEKIWIDINITQYMNLESSDCWFDHKTKQLITWSIGLWCCIFIHGYMD